MSKNLTKYRPVQKRVTKLIFEKAIQPKWEAARRIKNDGPLRTVFRKERERVALSRSKVFGMAESWLPQFVANTSNNNIRLRASKSRKLKTPNLKIYSSSRSVTSGTAIASRNKDSKHKIHNITEFPSQRGPQSTAVRRAATATKPVPVAVQPPPFPNARTRFTGRDKSSLNFGLNLFPLDAETKNRLSVRRELAEKQTEEISAAGAKHTFLPRRPYITEQEVQKIQERSRMRDFAKISLNITEGLMPLTNVQKPNDKDEQLKSLITNWNPKELTDVRKCMPKTSIRKKREEVAKPYVKINSNATPGFLLVNPDVKNMIALRKEQKELTDAVLAHKGPIAKQNIAQRIIDEKKTTSQKESKTVRVNEADARRPSNFVADNPNPWNLASAYVRQTIERYKDVTRGSKPDEVSLRETMSRGKRLSATKAKFRQAKHATARAANLMPEVTGAMGTKEKSTDGVEPGVTASGSSSSGNSFTGGEFTNVLAATIANPLAENSSATVMASMMSPFSAESRFSRLSTLGGQRK